MNDAARALWNTGDFSAFCRIQSQTKNRVCAIREAAWANETCEGDSVFKIVADRFLHGMVRAIVGTLLEIGHGKRSPEDLLKTIAARDRKKAGPAAPAKGLVLEEVQYDLA
jgi:tRNA pseudouridine38-40 synthase